jgi:uncharacterized protein (DUF4415 family)
MSKHQPLIDDDDEVRELTAADMRLFRPAAEVLPPDLLAGLIALKKQRGERGPQKAPTKVPTTIRFDADVLAALKASGKGWQTRVNEAVKDWLKSHSPA